MDHQDALLRLARVLGFARERDPAEWSRSAARASSSGSRIAGSAGWPATILRTAASQRAPSRRGSRDRFGRERRGGQHATALDLAAMRAVDAQAVQVALAIRRLGDHENQMLHRVWTAVARRPATAPLAMRMLFQYAQIRYMFRQGRYWEPQLAEAAGPHLGESAPAA
jgi:hypothetical protein